MLKNCDICGRKIANNAPVCPYCGATVEQREKATVAQGLMILLGGALCLLLNTFAYITESFNTVDRVENVWCGYLSGNDIRIYKDDIAKKGSSICLKKDSWRSSEKIHLYLPETLNYDNKIVIVKGEIKDEGYWYPTMTPQSISVWNE